MKIDALVIGAGPVGLTMAAELARYGVSVRIADKAARRSDTSKALVLWSRTLELMDRMGCTTSFVDAGHKVSGATINAGKKRIGHVTLGGVASPYPYALMLPQSDTERLMEAHLNNYGVQVERTVELTQLAASEEKVVSTLRHADGPDEVLESSWLIGCDGAHSTVRHQLGLKFQGDTLPSNWILADVHLSGVRDQNEIMVNWHSEGILAIFPISQGRYRVLADSGVLKDNTHPPDPTLEDVRAVLDRRGPGGIEVSAPIWLASFHINERKVAGYRAGRVFVAGDAAHIHSPAGGQGMNTGIQDACNLAWKLALVCRGDCAAEPLLGSYSIERSAIGDQVLKSAGRLTAVALMKGPIEQSLRNHIGSVVFGLSPVLKTMANTLTEVSIGYPKSPLTSRKFHIHGGPVAGERAPIRLAEQPVGAGDSPHFALFGEPSEAISELIAEHSNLLEPKLRKPFQEGGLWLVRPDGYVSLATKHDGADEVGHFLDAIAAFDRGKSINANDHPKLGPSR